MITCETIPDLPGGPAVYAMYAGQGQAQYVAYLGIAGKLRQRITQHLVNRDSGLTTATRAVVPNFYHVTEVRWWTSPRFEKRVELAAA